MGKFSYELHGMLKEFLIKEIKNKALSGITYALFFSGDEKDEVKIEKYKSIMGEVINCGYSKESGVFSIYEVPNGYIFDIDMGVARKITSEISKIVSRLSGCAQPIDDIIGDYPEIRRRSDMQSLARYIKQEFKKGSREVEVALFSRNSVPRIVITGVDANGRDIAIRYNSYAIKHKDIETINKNLLIPDGVRISKVIFEEILPSKTGCRFRLQLVEVVN